MKDKSDIWGGRFESHPSRLAEIISESISFDHVLYDVDIRGSLAHVRMLKERNIISTEAYDKIESGLLEILNSIREKGIEYHYELEDIHMHIESLLTEKIGEDGKRLHTGRSRNDQVALDTHLYLKEAIENQSVLIRILMERVLELAEEYSGKIWAGYTHTQIAQPVLLSHYLLSWFWKFSRDYNLMNFSYQETCRNPLGSAAMGGPNYPIDPDLVRKELGMKDNYENSMDAVSNRDYQLSYHFFVTRLGIHASRLCEDLILYNSAEYSYVRFSDAVTTGSSIMPQKKNPDIAELLRAKSGRLTGNMNALLMNLKSLPLTYNRDLQEDKIYLFDSIKTGEVVLRGLYEIVNNVEFFPEKVIDHLEKGYSTATDLADYLVREYGMTFRDAHYISGAIVGEAEKKKISLKKVPKGSVKKILKPYRDEKGKKIKLDLSLFTVENSIKNRQGEMSTSPESVQKQMQKARDFLENMELKCF